MNWHSFNCCSASKAMGQLILFFCEMLMVSLCFQEERLRRGDDLRLQMALEESKKEGPDSVKLPKKKKEVN